jgi:hypothetical protein
MILVGAQKSRMAIEKQIVKTVLIRFQAEMRIPLIIGLKTIHVALWQRICSHCVHALRL